MEPKHFSTLKLELQGFALLITVLALLISIATFQGGAPEANWLGPIGHVLGGAFHNTLGATIYIFLAFMAWTAIQQLRGREHPRFRAQLLGCALFSLALFLRPHLSTFFGRTGGALFALSLLTVGLILLSGKPIRELLALLRQLCTWERPKKPDWEHLREIRREKPIEKKREPLPLPPRKIRAPTMAPPLFFSSYAYSLPPPSLLTEVPQVDQTELKKSLRHQADVLEETLQSFGIEARVGQINCGPTITSFEVHPAIGVKVQRIKALESDIALNMQARSIRIIAPIPGKAAVGIEIPNPEPQEVSFKELLHAYQRGKKRCTIPLLLGKAVNGEYVVSDLAKMPHCIIAGATGSGKSVCINTLIMSILFTAEPDEVKLLMIDPKKVELTPYARLPHMLAPVITEPKGALAALMWLVREMEKRYELLKAVGARNISSFNQRKRDPVLEESLDVEVPERLSYIVCIIDEFADLMMVSSHDIETPIARIAQMARAVGIHLVLATQRPSREVITGIIKANFPTRISFKVASRVNSQIVLDDTGAESLLGNGDMLILLPGSSAPKRAQGAYIRDEDVHRITDFIATKSGPDYAIKSFDHLAALEEGMLSLGNNTSCEQDRLFERAKQVVTDAQNASTTFLQRKLKIGYARAASLIDALEEEGIISANENGRRSVLTPNAPGLLDDPAEPLQPASAALQERPPQ